MTSMPPGATATQLTILCPHCRKPNPRRRDQLRRARFCQHCGQDIVLNNDGPRYYITRVIKEGGQGAVYEAVDDDMHIYAVKEMLDRFLDPKERDEAVARFEAEAKMLQSFRHPRVPRIYADFKDEGRHYLIMDFVRGEDLEDILKREGRIDEGRVLIWSEQICDVLQILHTQDPPIIFRDMKPSNIMIERDGGVKLIDFGIAKVFQPSQRGTQIGTPGYAPPEQYQGIATVESDVYALGATLHHLLTGRDPRDHMPFTFPPARSLNPAISDRTAAAVDKAVQKFASDRFHSIAELRDALRQRRKTQPLPAPQPSPPQPAVVPKQAPSQPPASVQRPPPAPAQPPVAVARPATQAQPQAGAIPAVPPAAPPAAQPKQRRGPRLGGVLFALVAILLIGATIVLAVPNLSGDLLPRISQSTPTAQVLIQQQFTINDVELVVPAGRQVRDAYTEVFLQMARQQYGEGTLINANAPPGFIGAPQELGQEAGGTKYRASMQGFILVPQS
jgi:serine/threonine-protein kinase